MITSSMKSEGRVAVYSAQSGGIMKTSIAAERESGDGQMAFLGKTQSDDILARAKR